jgi:lysophospholipase L1-like esterase
MKSILCFGDSNTWGWNPETAGRYETRNSWPGVMHKQLGNEPCTGHPLTNNYLNFLQ